MASSVFSEKYPHLALQLHIDAPSFNKSYLEEEKAFFENAFSFQADVIYFLGLCTNSSLAILAENWLKASSSRKIVFLETDLSRLSSFLASSSLLEHPQIVLEYFEKKGWQKHIGRWALAFPTASIHVVISSRYQKKQPRFSQNLKALLLKESFQVSWALREIVFSSTLLGNYLGQARKAKEAFSMEALKARAGGVPAIICGAGPSLDANIPILKKLADHALIFAAGSAITALSVAGINPHFLVAIDPNEHEFLRLKDMQSFETPMIHFLRLCNQVSWLCNGRKGIVPTKGLAWMELFESCIQEDVREIVEQMDPESSSVITFATALAVYLGCDPIIFCGVDLAHSATSTYSQHVSLRYDKRSSFANSEEVLILKKGVDGNPITTPMKWWIEAEALGRYIKKFRDKKFYNASLGIAIDGTTAKPLEEIFSSFVQRDLLGLSHSLSVMEPLNFSKEKLEAHIADFTQSKIKVEGLLEKMISLKEEEGIERLLLELDLEEESFYTFFLKPQREALQLVQGGFVNHAELYSALKKELREFVFKEDSAGQSCEAYCAVSAH